jgi:hypothetical protein
VLASLLGRIDTAAAFACATAAAVLVQALSYIQGTERNSSISIEPRGFPGADDSSWRVSLSRSAPAPMLSSPCSRALLYYAIMADRFLGQRPKVR